MRDILISFIVPVYNAEKSLDRCINSIINQSYTNIEIILINDGSIDNSKLICNKYAKEDNRVHVEHIKNSGVSNARNTGLNLASGEYIVFVDSDDYLEDDMLVSLVKYIKKYNSDIIVFDPVFEDKNGNILKFVTKNIEQDRLYTNKDILDIIFPWIYGNIYDQLNVIKRAAEKNKDVYPDCYNAPWQSIYKKSLIDNHRFNLKFNIYEDLLFNLEVLANANNIVYCEKPLYHYICNDGNSLSTKYHCDFINTKVKLFEEMKMIVDRYKLPQKLKDDLNYRIASDIISVFINESKNKNGIIEQYKNLRKYVDYPIIKNSIEYIYNDVNYKKNIFLKNICKNKVFLSLILVRIRLMLE